MPEFGPNPELERQEWAREQLKKFNLEPTAENIEAAIAQQEVNQIPEGYQEIANSLKKLDFDNPDPELKDHLKNQMDAAGIKSIMHAEGLTVWDHVSEIMRGIDQNQDLTQQEKQSLKLIILYHDLGKVEVPENETNQKRNQEQRQKGIMVRSMIGHADPDKIPNSWEKINKAMENQVEDVKLRNQYLKIIEYHMKALEFAKMSDSAIYSTVQKLGETDEERRATLDLLLKTSKTDGYGTVEILNKDGNLEIHRKELPVTTDDLWNKYLSEDGKAKEKERQAERDKKITIALGKSLGSYLGEKGLKGKIIGQVTKSLDLDELAEMNGERMRQEIDLTIGNLQP